MANIFAVVGVFLCIELALCNAACGTVYANGVSDAEKQIIVNKHNNLRTQIAQGQVAGQPRAINMNMLKWDDKLGQAAQNIANTCVFAHVGVNDDRFYVGQNLYKMMSTGYGGGASWEGAIQSWFNEHVNFRYPDISNGVTGHYTQVVWADTKYVGCGYTYFLQNGDNFPYQKLYVCNYGPGGNYVGQPPYETG